MTDAIIKAKSDILPRIKSFYMGPIYPALVCAVVLIGNLTALELFSNILLVILTVGSLLICDSIKPFIAPLCTFYMQVSLPNSPFYPSRSDYYATGWRLPCIIISAVLVFAAIFVFVFKNRVFGRIKAESTPLLTMFPLLTVAFLASGAFSSEWSIKNLLFGLANIFVYVLLFALIFHGFSDSDKGEELLKYLSYVAMLIALVISAELIHLYLTNENIFVNGSVDKNQVALGWGIWNLIGVSLTILIPVIFAGIHNNRYPWLYFATATLAWLMAVLTLSRNALIFSTLIYAVCVIISCFKGKNKPVFRIITAIGVVAAVILVILLWSKIKALLGDYFDRGFSDNGRFEIWSAAFKNFLEAPVFGNGFYTLKVENFYSYGPVPLMAHNTVLQLLSSMGVFGIAAYVSYMKNLFEPVVVYPTLGKTFLALSVIIINLQSMLDNFVFNFYPILFITVATAVIFKIDEDIYAL